MYTVDMHPAWRRFRPAPYNPARMMGQAAECSCWAWWWLLVAAAAGGGAGYLATEDKKSKRKRAG